MRFQSSVQDALQIHAASLVARYDVVGVGLGHRTAGGERTGEECLKIFVPRKLPPDLLSAGWLLPSHVAASDGTPVRVDIEEIGTFFGPPLRSTDEAIAANQAANEAFRAGHSTAPAAREALKTSTPSIKAPFAVATTRGLVSRRRPACGGTSIAHYRFSVGTLTVGVGDQERPDIAYILSCSHVLALASMARLGDPILQPSALEGGTLPYDFVGTLARFVPLSANPAIPNVVDGAIALAVPAAGVSLGQVADLGSVQGIRPKETLAIGERVRSVGSATGLLEGFIVSLNTTIKANYATLGLRTGTFVFEGQIVTTPMSAFGDSGALLLDDGNNAVGMLFAGSDLTTGYNPIEEVQQQLGIVISRRIAGLPGPAATQESIGSAAEPPVT